MLERTSSNVASSKCVFFFNCKILTNERDVRTKYIMYIMYRELKIITMHDDNDGKSYSLGVVGAEISPPP